MGVFKNPMGVLKRVNGGIEKIRWGYCVGSMGALIRVNGGMEKGSMVALKRINGGIEKDQWGHGERVNALVRVNGGIEKGQVRQGLGCGSDRGVAVGQTGGCLTGL